MRNFRKFNKLTIGLFTLLSLIIFFATCFENFSLYTFGWNSSSLLESIYVSPGAKENESLDNPNELFTVIKSFHRHLAKEHKKNNLPFSSTSASLNNKRIKKESICLVSMHEYDHGHMKLLNSNLSQHKNSFAQLHNNMGIQNNNSFYVCLIKYIFCLQYNCIITNILYFYRLY
jgi:hypothetical protein